MGFVLNSEEFADGGEIPSKYTCQGDDISPPLAWQGVPEGTRSFVLIVDDPDAPDPKAPRMTWVHWVLYNIPPQVTNLSAGATSSRLPSGAREGINDWKRKGYGGPCPPIGRHRYFHKLYALDTEIKEMANPTKADIEKAMKGHIIGKTQIVGTYEK